MSQTCSSSDQHTYRRPAENGQQQFVILAWPGESREYYEQFEGSRAAVKDTISAIADAAARFVRVKLLVEEKDLAAARQRFAASNAKNAHHVDVCTVSTGCPDVWMRDMAPTFTVSDDGTLCGVDWHFNGWGGQKTSEACLQLARSLLADFAIPRIAGSIVTEGGALEVDGEGTLIASESSLINDNRNPGKTKDQVEAELSRTLGIRKFIWVPGRKDLDSTDFHIDAVARFVRPGVVLCSRPRDKPTGEDEEEGEWIAAHAEVRQILAAATDARGRPLEVLEVLEPRIGKECWLPNPPPGARAVFSYANYLLVGGGGVILSQFGDGEADAAALAMVRAAFPEREVVPVYARSLGLFGGGIHCASQEVPHV
ncbi:peptidylarginine deiminase-like enzyme [Cordyceps militaris]|uniref:Peptidylarginine deiminase-like enzyme n=1 Tax=Cordyceps militaris TaxID=73501 RepID=A0A2H4SIF0_CORMI|nr:peptidylarginine deiminase-like enzyme [Cordyceps militaris]